LKGMAARFGWRVSSVKAARSALPCPLHLDGAELLEEAFCKRAL
jgi:hypothetical protein